MTLNGQERTFDIAIYPAREESLDFGGNEPFEDAIFTITIGDLFNILESPEAIRLNDVPFSLTTRSQRTIRRAIAKAMEASVDK